MGNDNLSIISFNSSRKGLLALSGQRPSYLQMLFESAEPDICFLPGDDKYAKLNVIRGYGQFTLPHHDDTVLLYNNNRVEMKKPQFCLDTFGPMRGLDFDKMVVPEVTILAPKPCSQVVKEFSMVSWKFDFFENGSVDAKTIVESIITFSQRLALRTGKPVLIGGEMKIDYSNLDEIVKKLSTDRQEEFLTNAQSVMGEQGYLQSMTKASLRDQRHLFMMKVFRCQENSSNADCFIASKQLVLTDASLLDVGQVTGCKIKMQLLQKHKPTHTHMEIPVRPPKHHGG